MPSVFGLNASSTTIATNANTQPHSGGRRTGSRRTRMRITAPTQIARIRMSRTTCGSSPVGRPELDGTVEQPQVETDERDGHLVASAHDQRHDTDRADDQGKHQQQVRWSLPAPRR